MSRPTNIGKYEVAEQWMRHSFGQGMRDYLLDDRVDPVSVAVVEVDQVLKKTNVRVILREWQLEDAKSAAGRPAILEPMAALTLILLQLRLQRPTLITEMADTILRLDKTHRKILGLNHDGQDSRLYDRVWNAVTRLIHLIDEFPGRRDKILTEAEFNAVLDARDAQNCSVKRERMFTLANTLLEGSRQLVHRDVLDRCDGNYAIDATFVPLYGKEGNPSPKNRTGRRRSSNYDGGWYMREGSHGAVTKADAAVLKQTDPNGDHHARKRSKRSWGIEVEIARTTANLHEKGDLFPQLTAGISFHAPGAVAGEGRRMIESIHDRGHRLNLVIVDRAYNNGLYAEYAVPILLRGGLHVFNYRAEDLGVQAHDPRGFVQVSGTWYLDTLPAVLREADKVILVARNKYKKLDIDADKRLPRRQLAAAEATYAKQLASRRKYMLKAKGRMAPDWTRRYLLPVDTKEYTTWNRRPGSHQGTTVMMKRPEGKEAEDANAGGLKHEQYFPFGDTDWTAAAGLRNGVESVNRNLKRSQYEDIADPDKRAVRGNTFTYLVVALATVIENLRQIINFYKRQLATITLTPKNNKLPETFWQGQTEDLMSTTGAEPPG
jgi:hypothetical protein